MPPRPAHVQYSLDANKRPIPLTRCLELLYWSDARVQQSCSRTFLLLVFLEVFCRVLNALLRPSTSGTSGTEFQAMDSGGAKARVDTRTASLHLPRTYFSKTVCAAASQTPIHMPPTERKAHHPSSPLCGAAGLDKSERRGVDFSRRDSWPLGFLPRESPTREDFGLRATMQLQTDTARTTNGGRKSQDKGLACACQGQRLAGSGGAVF
ncbi:uncharacterized protein J3D65DRAFT_354001 [Phyllosticta citribraziliensis]|uniref:Uncharacterized protein n=1 Tax=Phyllosticta citribraziliensis TaxID=989973 RepID=A0ABR1LPZ0_9PEZI